MLRCLVAVASLEQVAYHILGRLSSASTVWMSAPTRLFVVSLSFPRQQDSDHASKPQVKPRLRTSDYGLLWTTMIRIHLTTTF